MVPALACELCLPRSLHQLIQLPLHTTIPTLAIMCRRGKSIVPPFIEMLLTTTVFDIQRRVGDYHSNLWDDDFINSLISTPYEVISLNHLFGLMR